MLFMTACTDAFIDDEGGTGEPGTDKGIGQMILFTTGTTVSSVATRADGDGGGNSDMGSKNDGITITPGKTYYMPNDGRFVIRMYYKSSASDTDDQNDPYDVSGNSDVTTWMKVSGDVGNSLYWNKKYDPVDPSKKGVSGGVDDYGNDFNATALYWQNRKKHAFLAWTDLNKLAEIEYSPDKNSGGLKFDPADETYQKHTGEKKKQWVNAGYEVSPGREFNTWAAMRTFLETGSNYESLIKNHKPDGTDFTDQQYYYAYGWSCKYRYEKEYVEHNQTVDATHRKTGWTEYQIFNNKLPYPGDTSGDNIIIRYDAKGVPAYLFDQSSSKYLAQIEIKFYTLNSEGNPTTTIYTPAESDINVTQSNTTLDLSKVHDEDRIQKAGGETAIAQCKFIYNLTDDYGNVRYDEESPSYTFYFRDLEEEKEQAVIEEYQANVFDLTRKPVKDAQGNITYGIDSIGQQPDIIQALTEKAPLGATQESNRVNLYFKHQFSQVQVNIKTSADLSVVIDKDDIKKVELLGVSEKAYVFTELNENGKVEPTTYEHVDVSQYSDEHLAKNQYGTAFEMFDMAEGNDSYEYPTGYIKSYNAITFGQLQAIRITWEESSTNITHESTYLVGNEKLKNLQSGNKYVWNIELRRGTLAIVRTEIVDWIVPQNELEYGTNGTIEH